MSYLSRSFRDATRGREVMETELDRRTPDHPLAGSLKRVVRRILRTQSSRTLFQARVLEEARRLGGTQYGGSARDTLERLVVSQLLGDCPGRRLDSAPCAGEPLCPATQLTVFNSTLALQALRS